MKRTIVFLIALAALVAAPAIPSLAARISHRHAATMTTTAKRHSSLVALPTFHPAKKTIRTAGAISTAHSTSHLRKTTKSIRSTAKPLYTLTHRSTRTVSLAHKLKPAVHITKSAHKLTSARSIHHAAL